MKLKGFIFTAVAAVMAFAACQKTENLGMPDLRLSAEELTFGQDGGAQTITIKATRDWTAEIPKDANWVVLDPESGEVSLSEREVTITTLANEGMNRTANVKFTIGMKTKYLKVTQSGPSGSAEDLTLYFNDFDKEISSKNGSSWPYLDQFDGWKNEAGTGAANVTYTSKSASARATSKNNNIWLAKTGGYFSVQDIALNDATSLELSFSVICGSPGSYKKTFDSNVFKVYLSSDKAKWVEIPVAVTANGTEFDSAVAAFAVPSNTANLSIAFEKISDESDGYRIDNVNLVSSTTAGTSVDFALGTDKDFSAGGISGGGNAGSGSETSGPESKGKKTVEEFIAAADTQNYYELTGTVSGFNSQYCSFDLTDATGKIYVYSVLSDSKSEWSGKIANGGTITIYGKYEYYSQKSQHEVVDAHIVSYTASGDSGEVTPPAGDATMTIAQVLAHSGALPSDAVIEGVVISNMGLNNLTSKKGMYVQDETAGLQFYLAENHSFAFGDKVKIDLSGVTKGDYNGAVQISSLALAKIAKVSSGNTVTPKTVTMADFLANKYEGQYIALEGVQVASSDLSKTFVTGGAHTSINMEDANGNKFVVFSSKYATYGAETVPQGSGTIKGISSISKGVMQIIFTQTSDYAGLTGTRFDGAVVTPPAGGGEDGGEEGGDEGGEDPVTPPAGDATVAKLVMSTLGLANAANVDGTEIKVDDNITLVFKKAASGTAPAYYDASQGIRMYQNGATLDVKAASGKTISSIKFTFDYQQWYIAPDSGSLSAEGDVRTWTGSANAVKFTSTGTDKNHRAYVKAIEVTYY